MRAWLALGAMLAGMLTAGLPPEAAAQASFGTSWHDTKCVRYKRAWTSALAHYGTSGLGTEFRMRHQAFLDSNCTRRADVCARSPEELRLANVMVELSMNFGTASTFAPFYCRD